MPFFLLSRPPTHLARCRSIPRYTGARSQDPLSRFFSLTHKINITCERSQCQLLLYHHSRKKLDSEMIHSSTSAQTSLLLPRDTSISSYDGMYTSKSGKNHLVQQPREVCVSCQRTHEATSITRLSPLFIYCTGGNHYIEFE